MREVEAVWALEYQKSHADRLLRALDCYDDAFMFVRADEPRWAIQHLNEAAIDMTGAGACMFACLQGTLPFLWCSVALVTGLPGLL